MRKLNNSLKRHYCKNQNTTRLPLNELSGQRFKKWRRFFFGRFSSWTVSLLLNANKSFSTTSFNLKISSKTFEQQQESIFFRLSLEK